MEHPLTVRIRHCLADVDEPRQEQPELEPGVIRCGSDVKSFHGPPQRLPLDQTHRIKGSPVIMGSQSVNRHDSRMFQPASDPRLEQKPLPPDGVRRDVSPDLLQGDLTIELGIVGQEDLTQPPRCKRTKNSVPAGKKFAVSFVAVHGFGSQAFPRFQIRLICASINA